MKAFRVNLQVEFIKIRSSKTFWVSCLFFAFISAMMGLVMFVQMHPETSSQLGMIGNKANMMAMGEPGWISFSNMILQTSAGIGLVGIGFVSSWVFGQEFVYKTVKDLLALPVSRTTIVLSKFVIVVLWSILLFIIYLLVGLIISYALEIPPASMNDFSVFIGKYAISTSLSMLLCTPIVFFASYSRGVILPIGISILTVILANFSGMVGLGPYFPWSIPGVYVVSFTDSSISLFTSSYFILFLTSFTGFIATIRWWNYADHS